MAAASGFLVTLLFVILSIYPVIRVEDQSRYSMKIAGVVLGADLSGLGDLPRGTTKKPTRSSPILIAVGILRFDLGSSTGTSPLTIVHEPDTIRKADNVPYK